MVFKFLENPSLYKDPRLPILAHRVRERGGGKVAGSSGKGQNVIFQISWKKIRGISGNWKFR